MGSFSATHWIILAVTLLVVYGALKGLASAFRSGATLFCTACGHEGPTRTRTRGSLWIEAVLWLCLIVPGLIYSIWRMSSRHPICAVCGASTLVPPGTPVAMKMRRDLAKS